MIVKLSLCYHALLPFVMITALAWAEVPLPEKVYRIEIGSFDKRINADLTADRLVEQGLGPVLQWNEDDLYTVYLGLFDTNSEAWFYLRYMKDFGFLETSVASFANEGNVSIFDPVLSGDFEWLLVPETMGFSPLSVSKHELLNDADAGSFLAALALKDRELIISSGSRLVKSLDDSRPLKATVMIEVARALVQKEKESAPALPYLLKVSCGKVAAGKEDLIEARFMVADSWHYYWFAPLKAFRAYKEILAAHGKKDQVRTRCLVEMTACLLEIARMPNAEWVCSFEDVRRYAMRVKEEVPAEFVRAHAVAELMYAETYMYEHQVYPKKYPLKEAYGHSLALLDGFEERHPGRMREISMVNHMRGFLSFHLDRWEDCQEYFYRNMTTDLSNPRECFYWKGDRWNLAELGAKLLKDYAKEREDKIVEEEMNSFLDQKLFLTNAPGPVTEVDFDFAFPHQFYEEREH